MKVKDILAKKGTHVHTITPERTLQEAIALLVQHNIGSLMVLEEDGEIAGIVTERDILRQCASGGPGPDGIRVGDAMTADLIIGLPDDELNYVMGIMTKNRIRHLPIIEASSLHGMISIGDVVNAHMLEAEFENRMLRDYIHGVKA